MLVFKGIQKTTLVDFPGQVACTLFLSKCNFKCPYCYNSKLVFDKDTGVEIPENEIFDFLGERKEFLDGVCVTGGEPTLHPSLPEFFKKIKEKGFLVKLDTNGTNPKMLQELIEKKLVDYIAMDIKAPLEKYEVVASVKVNLENIAKSVDLIKASELDYEFRTTILPSFISEQNLFAIAKWLSGAKLYALQQFFPEGDLLDKTLLKARVYSRIELELMKKSIESYFGRVELRNV